MFAATLPTIGVGALQPYVDESTLYGTDKERTLFEPREETWQDIGEQCASEGVSVSMFRGMGRPIDIASIGKIHQLVRFAVFIFYRSCFCAEWRGDVLPPQVRPCAGRHCTSIPIPQAHIEDNRVFLLNANTVLIRFVHFALTYNMRRS